MSFLPLIISLMILTDLLTIYRFGPSDLLGYILEFLGLVWGEILFTLTFFFFKLGLYSVPRPALVITLPQTPEHCTWLLATFPKAQYCTEECRACLIVNLMD